MYNSIEMIISGAYQPQLESIDNHQLKNTVPTSNPTSRNRRGAGNNDLTFREEQDSMLSNVKNLGVNQQDSQMNGKEKENPIMAMIKNKRKGNTKNIIKKEDERQQSLNVIKTQHKHYMNRTTKQSMDPINRLKF